MIENSTLFAEALRVANDAVVCNLVTLLANYNHEDDFLAQVETKLEGNVKALEQLAALKQQAALPGEKVFRTVTADISAAEFLLALLLRLDQNLARKEGIRFVDESEKKFVNESEKKEISPYDIYSIVWQVYEHNFLSEVHQKEGQLHIRQMAWQDSVIPRLLQMPRLKEDQSSSDKTRSSFDDLDLVKVVSGGASLPAEWEEAKAVDFVRPWIERRINDFEDYLENGDIYGICTPQQSDYRPAIIHPLVLYILRYKLMDKLKAKPNLPRGLAQWLVNNLFNTDKGIKVEWATPECVFAAGAFVLALGQENINISDDGKEITGDWSDLAKSVVNTVVNNSEQRDDILPAWQGARERVRKLLTICSDWYTSPLIDYLHNRADEGEHLEDRLAALVKTVNEQIQKISVDKFNQEVDDLARLPFPELRTGGNIVDAGKIQKPDPKDPSTWKFDGWNTEDHERIEYLNYLDQMNEAVKNLDNETAIAKEVVQTIRISRTKLEERLHNPLINFRLPDLLQEMLSQGGTSAQLLSGYLQQQIGNLDLYSITAERGKEPVEDSLDTHQAWIESVNASIKDELPDMILQKWATIEMWDGLRGRLASTASPENIVDLLMKRPEIQNFLTEDGKLPEADALRPTLAALVHLGLPLNGEHYPNLVSRLETLLDPAEKDKFAADIRALLAAARLELGLTLLSTGEVEVGTAFDQLTMNETELMNFLNERISIALNSAVAWEVRAGMNALILLARLADTTGDLFLASKIMVYINGEERVKKLVKAAIDPLQIGTKTPGISALPLALVACDLNRSARQLSQGLVWKESIDQPGWLPDEETVGSLINSLADRFRTDPTGCWQVFAANGGLAGQALLLTIFQIKLDEFQRDRRVLVRPPERGEIQPLTQLRQAMRTTLCGAQLIQREAPDLLKPKDVAPKLVTIDQESDHPTKINTAVSGSVPWYQARYWAMQARPDIGIGKLKFKLENDLAAALDSHLNAGDMAAIRDAFQKPGEKGIKLSFNASIVAQMDDPKRRLQQWVIIDPIYGIAVDRNSGLKKEDYTEKDEKAFVIKLEKKGDQPAHQLQVYDLASPFQLVNWLSSHSGQAEVASLTLAAQLEAATPMLPPKPEEQKFIYSVQLLQDIDGRYPDEFPVQSFQAAKGTLVDAVNALSNAEGKYKNALNEQRDGKKHEELVNLLKAPLRLSTADYREQLQAALADVRAAEAELAAAEHESLAWQFEQIASGLIYESTKVELQRQEAQLEITRLDEDISALEVRASESGVKVEDLKIENANLTTEQKEIAIEREAKKLQKAHLAAQAIKQEIELIRKVLGAPVDAQGKPENQELYQKYKVAVILPDGNKTEANGQIGAIAAQVEYSVKIQLAKDLAQVETDLAEVRAKEREQKRKAKRRQWVSAVCRFVGTAVGAYFGAPALGAAIGSAMGEVVNGVMDDKPPEEIMVGLIDDGFAIAQAAGYDPKAALNKIGEKVGTEVEGYFAEIEASLGPIMETLPTVFDEMTMKQAFELLDLEEVPALASLIGETYKALKTETKNLGKLGDALVDAKTGDPIAFGNSQQLLARLKETLLAKTGDNVKQLHALGRAVGEQIEELQTTDGQEKVAERVADRLSKMVITQLSELSGNYRRQTLQKWINTNLKAEKTWEVVQAEGEALVAALFPDAITRSKVITNIKSVLVPKAQIRGQLQSVLQPWQTQLDDQLNEIMRLGAENNSGGSAVQALEQRKQYLVNMQTKFEGDLIPWMRGRSGDQTTRINLLKTLSDKEQEIVQAQLDIEMTEAEIALGKIELDKAKNLVLQSQELRKQAETYYQKAQLNVSKASWQNKVAELAKLKAENLKEAQFNSTQAVEARRQAAQDKVRAAQANLEVKQALAEAAVRRGAEASRIRATLSYPPLRGLNLTESTLIHDRSEHAYQLDRALKAYRELVRFQRAIEGVAPTLERPDSVESTGLTWSEVLTNWRTDLDDSFKTDDAPKIIGPAFLEWSLSPQQIAAITSPSGFRLVLGPHLEEEPHLFDVSADLLNDLGFVVEENSSELEAALKEPNLVAWQQVFKERHLELSEDCSLIKDKKEDNLWRLIDNGQNKVFLIARIVLSSGATRLRVHAPARWQQEFNSRGISLSDRFEVTEVIKQHRWELIDYPDQDILINTYHNPYYANKKDENKFININSWEIPPEPKKYRIDLEANTLKISGVFARVNKPGRFTWPDRLFDCISESQARTGHVAGIFLRGFAKSSGAELGSTDYQVEVYHQGDTWHAEAHIPLRLGNRADSRALGSDRAKMIREDDDPRQEITTAIEFAKGSKEIEPFETRGTPLSGTTVIRLDALGKVEFEQLQLNVIFTYYQ